MTIPRNKINNNLTMFMGRTNNKHGSLINTIKIGMGEIETTTISVNGKQYQKYEINSLIEHIVKLVQQYNGRKDRVKLALGGRDYTSMQEYVDTLDEDIAVMRHYSEQIITKYNILQWKEHSKTGHKPAKSVQKKIEALRGNYADDIKGFAEDFAWIESEQKQSASLKIG